MEASDSLRQKKIKFFLSYTWHIHIIWDTHFAQDCVRMSQIWRWSKVSWATQILQQPWIFMRKRHRRKSRKLLQISRERL